MKASLTERVQRSLRETFTENLRLKALAGIITVLVFFLVRGGREVSTRISVDINAIRPAVTDGRILMNEIPDAVTLRVLGAPGIVQNLDEDEIPSLTIDVRNERDGTLTLDPSLFRLPPGVEVQSIRPASIELDFEPRIRQELPVLPVIGGQVGEGYHVKDPIGISPTKVTVSGPASVMRDLHEIRTVLVNVEALGPGRHKRQVLLERPPPSSIYETEEQVEVTVVIEPDIIERVFPEAEVEVRGTSLLAEAEQVNITIAGSPDIVEQLDIRDFDVFVEIDAGDNAPGTYREEVQIEGLDDPLEVTVEPSTVIVELRPVETPPPQEPDAGL